jgi:hypothetical protein
MRRVQLVCLQNVLRQPVLRKRQHRHGVPSLVGVQVFPEFRPSVDKILVLPAMLCQRRIMRQLEQRLLCAKMNLDVPFQVAHDVSDDRLALADFHRLMQCINQREKLFMLRVATLHTDTVGWVPLDLEPQIPPVSVVGRGPPAALSIGLRAKAYGGSESARSRGKPPLCDPTVQHPLANSLASVSLPSHRLGNGREN